MRTTNSAIIIWQECSFLKKFFLALIRSCFSIGCIWPTCRLQQLPFLCWNLNVIFPCHALLAELLTDWYGLQSSHTFIKLIYAFIILLPCFYNEYERLGFASYRTKSDPLWAVCNVCTVLSGTFSLIKHIDFWLSLSRTLPFNFMLEDKHYFRINRDWFNALCLLANNICICIST